MRHTDTDAMPQLYNSSEQFTRYDSLPVDIERNSFKMSEIFLFFAFLPFLCLGKDWGLGMD